MTKTTSIVLICILTVIALFFGIFAFILDGQAIGLNDYNNAYSLIQKSTMFGDKVQATYQIQLDEGAEVKDVIKILKSRLQGIYGYYSVNITEDDGILTIDLPKATYAKASDNETPNSVDTRILSNITKQGKFEILSTQYGSSSSEPTYSESLVVLDQSHLRNATTRNYANNGSTAYICQASLTKEGNELIKKAKLTDGSMYYCALNGEISNIVAYNNGKLQIYGNGNSEVSTRDNTKLIASIINKGTLDAALTPIESPDVVNTTGWIFALVMGLIVLGTFVFFAVRYKTLGIAGILSQLIVSVAFIYIIALISLSMFNLAAAIALILAYAFMTFFTIFTFERIRARSTEKTFTSAVYYGFHSTNIISLIAHGALLVLGIILWVIPTAVTAPMGTIFVCGALLSFAATFGLNRLFVKFVEPFYETSGKTIAKK